MTQPSYTTNLTTLDEAESNTGWSEFIGDLSYDDHGSVQGADADWPFIQNTYAVTQTCSASKGGIGSMGHDNGSGTGGHGTDGAYLVWQLFANSNYESYADGGLRVVVGDSYTAFKSWDVGGNDKGVGLFLGWQNHAVNTTVSADDTTSPAPTSTEQVIGAAVNTGTVGIGKGEPHAVDVIRYGRCDAVFEYGDATSGYCTIDEFARANDANDISFTADTTNADATLTNISPNTSKLYPGAPISGTGIPASTEIKSITDSTTAEMTANATATNTGTSVTCQPYNVWGLIQKVPGGYLWKGLLQLGTATNAVDFRDENVIIFIQWCPKVTTNFNTIEIVNASSRVDMTNFSFIQLDTSTASDGRWISTNDADVNLDNVLFQDMGTFTFDSLNDVLNCTFLRCAQVTTGGADMAGSSFLASTVAADTGALYCDTAYTDTDFDNCTFEMGDNSHHAIDFGTAVTSNLTLRNCDFSGFGSTDDSNDSTVRFLATSGSLTLSLQNCTVDGAAASESNFSVDDAAGIAVSLSIDPVTVKATCVKTNGAVLQNIRVFAAASAKSSGTATTDTASKLVDTGATFSTDGVAINDIAFNQTDGTYATVSAVDSETSLSLSSDAFPDGNEDYRVGGRFPDEDTVTIVNSGTTATVTHTAHGMLSNDYVYIEGGSLDANRGVFQITYINANSYSYTMLSTPGSSPTGTITATFVALYGLSNASGIVTTTRVYATDQPVSGWGRNTVSGQPYYKEGIITGTISASDGLNTTVVLVSDE